MSTYKLPKSISALPTKFSKQTRTSTTMNEWQKSSEIDLSQNTKYKISSFYIFKDMLAL